MPPLETAVPLLHDHLVHAARRLPDKVALVVAKERYTYAELDARSNQLAHALVQRGVARGDRVIVFADNTVETVIAFWGVLKANAVVSIINPQTKADKLTYYLNDSRATAIISDAHLGNVLGDAARRAEHLKATIVSGKLDARFEGLPGLVGWEEALAEGDRAHPPPRRTIDVDLAAIIYTSGSTGDP